MLTPSLRQEFTQLLVTRSRVVCSILVDSLFLLVWLIVQLVFAGITARVNIAGAENWAFPIAQAVLAISTLAAILLYIYWDPENAVRPGSSPIGGAQARICSSSPS